MPWQEATPMEQRERFVRDQQRGLYTMTELCARYSISRRTGYKWLDRFDAGGRAALQDRSRAPHRCPHAMSDEIAQLICDARRAHPTWGPAKLLDWLTPRHPDLTLPAASTAGDLLAREGLVTKRRRRRTDQHPRRGPSDHDTAQRPVDRRFQGPVSDRRRPLLLPPHRRRSAHPLSARVPGAADDQGRGCADCL